MIFGGDIYYVPGDFSPECRLLNFIGYLGLGRKKRCRASEAPVGCELLGFDSSFQSFAENS